MKKFVEVEKLGKKPVFMTFPATNEIFWKYWHQRCEFFSELIGFIKNLRHTSDCVYHKGHFSRKTGLITSFLEKCCFYLN